MDAMDAAAASIAALPRRHRPVPRSMRREMHMDDPASAIRQADAAASRTLCAALA
jgi:hypothetical protein